MEDGPESRGNLFYKDKIILYLNVFKRYRNLCLSAISVPFCDKILLLNRMELKTKI